MSIELKLENISEYRVGAGFKDLEEKAILLGARDIANTLTRKFGHSVYNSDWSMGKFLRSYEAHTSCERCKIEIAIMQRGADSRSFRFQNWGSESIAAEIQIESRALYNSSDDSALVSIDIEKRSLGWFTSFIPMDLNKIIYDYDLINYFCPRYRNLFNSK